MRISDPKETDDNGNDVSIDNLTSSCFSSINQYNNMGLAELK